jgi:hypothetical protein
MCESHNLFAKLYNNFKMKKPIFTYSNSYIIFFSIAAGLIKAPRFLCGAFSYNYLHTQDKVI